MTFEERGLIVHFLIFPVFFLHQRDASTTGIAVQPSLPYRDSVPEMINYLSTTLEFAKIKDAVKMKTELETFLCSQAGVISPSPATETLVVK